MYKILITSSNKYKILKEISCYLIKKRLSPCIHIIKNIESFYLWKHEVINENECLILVKCLNKNIKEIEQVIYEKHNYTTPEIISHEFNIISKKYEKWFNTKNY